MAIRYDRYKVSVPGRLYLSVNECAGLVLRLLPEYSSVSSVNNVIF